MLEFIEALESDAHEIAVIRQRSWNNTYRGMYSDDMIDNFDYDFHESKIKNIIANDQRSMLKLIFDGKLIGYMSYGVPTFKCFEGNNIHLYSLYILKEYQAFDFGKMALDYLEEICKKYRKEFIYLSCNSHNIKAKQFYSYMNFELLREHFGNGAKEEDLSFYRKAIPY